MNVGNFTGNGSMNGSSGNHTAISGGRKPTADSHAYTLYKPNKANARGKFSNGGGSISEDNKMLAMMEDMAVFRTTV